MTKQGPASKVTFHTLEDVAKLLDCSKEHVRRLCNTGELKAVKIGGLTSPWRIRADWLDAWAEANVYNPSS